MCGLAELRLVDNSGFSPGMLGFMYQLSTVSLFYLHGSQSIVWSIISEEQATEQKNGTLQNRLLLCRADCCTVDQTGAQ